mmetsp:Transcript_96137/g.133373  ORF Transcript_96137/g.133373 Transcript_96137/m.133373 type:complete len:356 (+) Transcript_96137:520-1587(+)
MEVAKLFTWKPPVLHLGVSRSVTGQSHLHSRRPPPAYLIHPGVPVICAGVVIRGPVIRRHCTAPSAAIRCVACTHAQERLCAFCHDVPSGRILQVLCLMTLREPVDNEAPVSPVTAARLAVRVAEGIRPVVSTIGGAGLRPLAVHATLHALLPNVPEGCAIIERVPVIVAQHRHVVVATILHHSKLVAFDHVVQAALTRRKVVLAPSIAQARAHQFAVGAFHEAHIGHRMVRHPLPVRHEVRKAVVVRGRISVGESKMPVHLARVHSLLLPAELAVRALVHQMLVAPIVVGDAVHVDVLLQELVHDTLVKRRLSNAVHEAHLHQVLLLSRHFAAHGVTQCRLIYGIKGPGFFPVV